MDKIRAIIPCGMRDISGMFTKCTHVQFENGSIATSTRNYGNELWPNLRT